MTARRNSTAAGRDAYRTRHPQRVSPTTDPTVPRTSPPGRATPTATHAGNPTNDQRSPHTFH